MLGLMRGPKVPTDLRLEMAVAAAPFVHLPLRDQPRQRSKARAAAFSYGKTSSRQGGAGLTIRRGPIPSNSSTRKMEGKLNEAGDHDEAPLELLPLDYLVSVMRGSDAAPRDRIKAARAAAPYLPARPEMDDMPIVIEDPFEFPVDSLLAKDVREDQQRAVALRSRRMLTLKEAIKVHEAGGLLSDLESSEYRDLTARLSKRPKTDCPPRYGAREEREDEARIAELSPKFNGQQPKRPLTAEEVAELHHLQFRLWVYKLSPAREAHMRMGRLLLLRDKDLPLTADEARDLNGLLCRYPEHHAHKYELKLSEAMDFYGRKEGYQNTGSESPNGADGDLSAPNYADSPDSGS